MELMRLEGLSVLPRLAPLSLTIEAGQMIGVIGANGAGKSTLLKALAGVIPSQGSVLLENGPLPALSPKQRAQRIGYLPQNQSSAWSLTVEDIVALGRAPWGDQNAAAIDQALSDCALKAWRQRPVAELSGGEQARVWLARVLAGQPQILLADEPLASLDLLHQRNIMQLLRQQARASRAVVVAIHDLSLAARYCDLLVLLCEGQLLALGTPAEVLTKAHLQRAFGLELHIDLDSDPPILLPK